MNDKDYEVAFQIIAFAGDAKSNVMTAIRSAKNGEFDAASTALSAADASLNEAHAAHKGLLTEEASGNPVPLNIILIHAQDHLTSALLVRDLASEVIDIHRELKGARV